MPRYVRRTDIEYRGKHCFKAGGKAYTTKPGDVIELDEGLAIYGGAADWYTCLDNPKDVDDDLPALLLKAVHKGGGRWVVINVETGHQINDGYLKKDEAAHLVEIGEVEEVDDGTGCPIDEFGHWDEFQECDDCLNAKACKAVKDAEDDEG